MKPKNRQSRQKRGDRLLHPDARKNEIACHEACAPFDGAVRAANLKWGVDRLMELVTPATAAKYGTSLDNLNRALDALIPADVIACVESCLRGIAYMDAEAERTGQPKANPEIWEADVDGFKFGILPDSDYWPAAQKERPDLRLFTLREIGVALKSFNLGHAMVDAAKKIGGAEIVAIHEKAIKPLPSSFWKEGGDQFKF